MPSARLIALFHSRFSASFYPSLISTIRTCPSFDAFSFFRYSWFFWACRSSLWMSLRAFGRRLVSTSSVPFSLPNCPLSVASREQSPSLGFLFSVGCVSSLWPPRQCGSFATPRFSHANGHAAHLAIWLLDVSWIQCDIRLVAGTGTAKLTASSTSLSSCFLRSMICSAMGLLFSGSNRSFRFFWALSFNSNFL